MMMMDNLGHIAAMCVVLGTVALCGLSDLWELSLASVPYIVAIGVAEGKYLASKSESKMKWR